MWMNNFYGAGYWPYSGFQNPDIVFGTTHRSYTERIEEWLKRYNPELDPLDVDAMLEAGKETIFKNMNLNVLSDQYKELFIIQFLSEFWMNEIGQPTEDWFRQNLFKTIQNHGAYIKSLYELAEKKYFFQYSYKTSDGKHAQDTVTNDSKTSDQTNSQDTTDNKNRKLDQDSKDDTTTENTKQTDQNDSRNVDNSNAKTVDGTTGNTQTNNLKSEATKDDSRKSGRDETRYSGDTTGSETKSGSDTSSYEASAGYKEGVDKSDKDLSTVTGTDDTTSNTTYNGSISNTKSYPLGGLVETHSGTDYNGSRTTNYQAASAIQKMSDTPQNGLVGLMNDQYMSEATVRDDKSGTDESNYGAKTYGEVITRTGSEINTEDKSGYSENQTTHLDRDMTTSNEYERHSDTDGRDYKGNRSLGYDAAEGSGEGYHGERGIGYASEIGTSKDVKNDTGTVKNDGSNHSEETGSNITDETGEMHNTQVDNGTTNATGEMHQEETTKGTTKVEGTTHGEEEANGTSKVTGTNNVIEESYVINRDAIFMGQDITNKIWELFDDCFMQVL